MTYSVSLETFFRRSGADDETVGSEQYLTGFQNSDGDPWGMTVPLDRDDVDPVVLKGAVFSLSMEANGVLCIEAEGRTDRVTELIAASCNQAGSPLDFVVQNALEPELLAMEDDALGELTQLRNRLIRALELVDAAMRTLEP